MYPMVYNFYPTETVMGKLMNLVLSQGDLNIWEGFNSFEDKNGNIKHYPCMIDSFE
jgi:hypothetical protein